MLLALTVDTARAAIAIAICGLVISALSYRRAGRADRRDQERHEIALADAASRRRSEPILSALSTRNSSDGVIVARVSVRNRSAALARKIGVWLVDDDGRTVSSVAGGDTVTLAPADQPIGLSVDVDRSDVPESELNLLRWRVAWTDEEGKHEHTTDVRPP
jgi:hypothetical protein